MFVNFFVLLSVAFALINPNLIANDVTSKVVLQRASKDDYPYYIQITPSVPVKSIQILAGKHWYDLSDRSSTGEQMFSWDVKLNAEFDKNIVYRLVFEDGSNLVEKAERLDKASTLLKVTSPFSLDEGLSASATVSRPPLRLEDCSQEAQVIIKDINQIRKARGLSQLRFDPGVAIEASLSQQASDILNAGPWSYSANTHGVWGTTYPKYNVVSAWMNSPPLAKIMFRDSYTNLGISIVDSSVYVYFK